MRADARYIIMHGTTKEKKKISTSSKLDRQTQNKDWMELKQPPSSAEEAHPRTLTRNTVPRRRPPQRPMPSHRRVPTQAPQQRNVRMYAGLPRGADGRSQDFLPSRSSPQPMRRSTRTGVPCRPTIRKTRLDCPSLEGLWGKKNIGFLHLHSQNVAENCAVKFRK